MIHRQPRDLLFRTGIAVAATLAAFPLVWLCVAALKTNQEIFTDPWGLPKNPQWGNFAEAWRIGQIGRYAWNSVVVTVTSVFATMALACLASYAFARLQFRGRNVLLVLFLVGLILPVESCLLPLFTLLDRFRLIDTYWALILPYTALALPLAIYILEAYLRSIPGDLEDSARIDGCGTLGVFWHIIVPIVQPALATVGIITALSCWNEFLMALLFLKDEASKTLPLGLMGFSGQHVTRYNLLLAALAMTTAPMLLIYWIFQRHIIEGLTVGAVKG